MGKTFSANEIFKKVFDRATLVNTKIEKRGKLTRDIAYEIASVRDGMYMGNCILTILSNKLGKDSFNFDFLGELGLEKSYQDVHAANNAISSVMTERRGFNRIEKEINRRYSRHTGILTDNI